MLHELVLYIGRVGTWLINLVDSNDDRYTGILGMMDCLYGLWHYAVIGSYNQDGNICYLGTTGTHGSKCLMAWGIQEDNLLALALNLICTNMLGNAASLMGRYGGFADNIQQGGLAVVNMAHYSNNWWTKYQALWIINDFRNQGWIHLWWQFLDIDTELASYQGSSIKVNFLVDCCHYAHQEQLLDDLGSSTAHLAGQILDDDGLPYLDVLRAGNFHLWSLWLAVLVAIVLIAVVSVAKAAIVKVVVAAILAITVIAAAILAVTIIFIHSVSTLHPVVLLIIPVVAMGIVIAVMLVAARTAVVIAPCTSMLLLAIAIAFHAVILGIVSVVAGFLILSSVPIAVMLAVIAILPAVIAIVAVAAIMGWLGLAVLPIVGSLAALLPGVAALRLSSLGLLAVGMLRLAWCLCLLRLKLGRLWLLLRLLEGLCHNLPGCIIHCTGMRLCLYIVLAKYIQNGFIICI